MKKSLAPSKKSVVESLKVIVATQSGYLLTNIPQTGHLSFADGEGVAGGAARADENDNARQSRSSVVRCLNSFMVIPFAKMIQAKFPEITNVKLTNDANAAALGELIFGGGKEMKNFYRGAHRERRPVSAVNGFRKIKERG